MQENYKFYYWINMYVYIGYYCDAVNDKSFHNRDVQCVRFRYQLFIKNR